MSEENKACDETGHWGRPKCYCGALTIKEDGKVSLRGKRDWQNFFTGYELRCWARTAPLEDDVYEHMARHYNAIVRKELEKAKRVFSGPEKDLGLITEEWSIAEFEGEDTHTALLIDERLVRGK